MGDVGSFLFGDTEDAKQVGNAPVMTPEQQAILAQLSGILGGQLGKGITPYEGDTAAGATSNQQNVFDMVNNITSGKDMMGMESLIGKFDPTATTDFFSSTVAQPAMKAWEKDILPVIRENYISQNAGSSGAANRAIATSGSDLASSLSSSLAEMLYGAKTTHEQNLPVVLQQILGMGLGAGAEERGINQDQLTADYSKWASAQPYNNPWLAQLNTALGAKAFEPIVQGPSTQSGLLSTIMPALASYIGSDSGSEAISNLFGSGSGGTGTAGAGGGGGGGLSSAGIGTAGAGGATALAPSSAPAAMGAGSIPGMSPAGAGLGGAGAGAGMSSLAAMGLANTAATGGMVGGAPIAGLAAAEAGLGGAGAAGAAGGTGAAGSLATIAPYAMPALAALLIGSGFKGMVLDDKRKGYGPEQILTAAEAVQAGKTPSGMQVEQGRYLYDPDASKQQGKPVYHDLMNPKYLDTQRQVLKAHTLNPMMANMGMDTREDFMKTKAFSGVEDLDVSGMSSAEIQKLVAELFGDAKSAYGGKSASMV